MNTLKGIFKKNKKKYIEKTEDKLAKFLTFVSNSHGKSYKPTPMAKLSGIKHVETLKNYLHLTKMFQKVFKDVNIEIIEDDNKKIQLVRITKNKDNKTLELLNEILKEVKR